MLRRLSFLMPVLWVLCAACSPAATPPPPSTPTASAPTPLLIITTSGGLCPYGLCQSQFSIDTAGLVLWHEGKATPQASQITASEVTALQAQIAAADFNALRARPFTELCPTAMDGSEVVYTFYTAHGAEVLASCTVAIDHQNPLIQQADTLWQKAVNPAPADSP